MDNSKKNDKTERARGLGRKNKRGDRKGESNDSPEIQDRGVTIRHPRPPYGAQKKGCTGVGGSRSKKARPLAQRKLKQVKQSVTVLQNWSRTRGHSAGTSSMRRGSVSSSSLSKQSKSSQGLGSGNLPFCRELLSLTITDTMGQSPKELTGHKSKSLSPSFSFYACASGLGELKTWFKQVLLFPVLSFYTECLSGCGELKRDSNKSLFSQFFHFTLNVSLAVVNSKRDSNKSLFSQFFHFTLNVSLAVVNSNGIQTSPSFPSSFILHWMSLWLWWTQTGVTQVTVFPAVSFYRPWWSKV